MIGERLLGLDLGEKRVGVAISDELGLVASPVTTLPGGPGLATALGKVLADYGVKTVVVGLPVGMSGKEGPQAKTVRELAGALQTQLGFRLEWFDERLSSTVAERALIAQGTRRERRKERIDAMAAAVILQGYLDAQRWKSGARS